MNVRLGINGAAIPEADTPQGLRKTRSALTDEEVHWRRISVPILRLLLLASIQT